MLAKRQAPACLAREFRLACVAPAKTGTPRVRQAVRVPPATAQLESDFIQITGVRGVRDDNSSLSNWGCAMPPNRIASGSSPMCLQKI